MLPDTITEIIDAAIHDRFSVLDSNYITNLMPDALDDINKQMEKEFEVRYLVIDGETGQIESRTLNETYEEAEKTADALDLKSYHIGTLFVPVLD